jgi:transcriptional regulator with XRE-family HTH domain
MPDRAARLQRQLGGTVRSERFVRNLTQKELAFGTGFSLTYIGELERGERMASIYTFVRLAEALGLKPSEFLAKAGL